MNQINKFFEGESIQDVQKKIDEFTLPDYRLADTKSFIEKDKVIVLATYVPSKEPQFTWYEPNNLPTTSYSYKPLKEGVTLEAQVTNLLFDLGISPHLRGFKCLRAALLLIVEDSTYLNALTKRLYPDVASKALGDNESRNGSRAERLMRHSIELAWEGDHNIKRFVPLWATKRPTIVEFLAIVVEKCFSKAS